MPERGEKHPSQPAASCGQPRKPEMVTITLGQRERRIIFREMVKAEIEAGLLRYSKRRQLLRYSSKLGIPQFEASLMIAQVQHRNHQLNDMRLLTADQIRAKLERARDQHKTMRTILLATAASIMINALMFTWLL